MSSINALSVDQHFMAARMCQIAAVQARISYWQSMLATGAYEGMQLFHPRPNGDKVSFFPNEKRDYVFMTINNLIDQLQRMQDFHEEAAASRTRDEYPEN